jgi:hypothetical protein
MIQGIQIDFTTEQLREHLADRIGYHETKASWYAQQTASLREGMTANPGMTADPIRALEESRKDHAKRASTLTIIRDHLVPSETYRLTEGDMSRVELIDRGW